jgi:hypothetical protein
MGRRRWRVRVRLRPASTQLAGAAIFVASIQTFILHESR